MASSGIAAWPPLESNPQVMNEFAHQSGLPEQWAFSDVLGLDEELLCMIPQPSLALIFLFPIKSKTPYVEENCGKKKCFFIRQIRELDQACGTLAMLHALANNVNTVCLADGPILKFIKQNENSNSESLGILLAKNEEMSSLHTSFANEGQSKAMKDGEESDHHFVCFTLVEDHLYEFDGCKPSPTDHGPADESSFLSKTATVIRESYLKNPDVLDFAMISLGPSEDMI